MRKNMETTEDIIQDSSGNVFADLQLPDAQELYTKSKLGATLVELLMAERATQVQLADRLGISQPKVSALLHYKFEGFSVERILAFLVKLNQTVAITVGPAAELAVYPYASLMFRQCRTFSLGRPESIRSGDDYRRALNLSPDAVPQPIPRIRI
jgi:predicted XRE-type DNA-binding protein